MINVVAKEQIIGIGWIPAHLKQTQEIVILSSNISYDFYPRFELQQDWLRQEDFLGLCAKPSYFWFEKLNLSFVPRAADFEQPFKSEVYVKCVNIVV